MNSPSTMTLRPILDLYMDSAVAILGCQSRGIARESCEWDVLVVGGELRPQTSLKLPGLYVDLFFITEKEALSSSNPEVSVALAYAKPVRDTSLILSTGTAANAAVLASSSKKACGQRLASALKILGRVEESITTERIREADFWLLAASYEFAYAWAYSSAVPPSPSHLLHQLKSMPKGNSTYFEAFSRGAGLSKGTRAGSGSRLEGLTVLHDVMRRAPHSKTRRTSAWTAARLEIVSTKAEALARRIELAECYSFMGQELVDYLMAMSKPSQGKATLEPLFSGEVPLLGDRLLRQLGLSRDKKEVEAALAGLRGVVTELARAT
jgi:GAF domain-containing protein